MKYQELTDLLEQENQNSKENKKQDQKFKDKCDICSTFDYCRGYNGKVLCKLCIENEISQSNIMLKGQMNIFDFVGGNYEFRENSFVSKSS